MVQCWNNEPIKVILTFDNGKTYETSTHSLSGYSVVSFNKNEEEQINYTNLFGSINSNEINMKLFDVLDRLNCENKKSPFYGYMRQGVEVKAYISYDDEETWEDYGTYYVTDWSGVYSNGFQDVVNIRAVDEMHYILNNDVPKLSTYSGIKADELIYRVLTGCGVDKNRIKIDKSLNTELRFGLAEDEKVGYFLNEICQALCAVAIINDHNEILIMPTLTGYNNYYDLDDKYIEIIENCNNNKSIYTNVKCRYNKRKGKSKGSILNDTVDLVVGTNNINNLEFGVSSLNIREIRVETEESIDIRSFSAYQNGIDIEIISDSAIEETDVTVSGEYINSVEKYVKSEINYTDQKNNRKVSYEIFNRYVQCEEDAQIVADKMAKYIELMNHRIKLRTVYTPRIALGDILNFDNEFLQGKYKVIASNTSHGEVYEKNLTLIPCSTVGVWDDSKSWNDDANWLENLSLSLS